MILPSIPPSPLQIGDTIGVMAPSSYIEKSDLNAAKAIVESYGYTVKIHDQTLARYNQSAGTTAEKCEAFHDLIRDPDVSAIIFATGGNTALHWVDQIDWNLIRENPKIMMGFSDVTSILNLVTLKTGLTTFYGPNFRWFMVNEDNKADIEQCFETLSVPQQFKNPQFGGCASLFQYLIDDMKPVMNGATLFLEDWNIETTRLDLMICAMKRWGVFDMIDHLILGDFEKLQDTGRPFGFSLDDIIAMHVPARVQITKNHPFGHGNRLITQPIGFATSS